MADGHCETILGKSLPQKDNEITTTPDMLTLKYPYPRWRMDQP